MTIRARLTSDPDGSICLESTYDRTFVECLKRDIPYDGRRWDPDRKRWIVSALYAAELVHFLHSYGATIQDDRDGIAAEALQAIPAMPADLKEAFDALHLQYTAPIGAAEAVWRFMNKHFHPDKGGSGEECLLFNDAIETIRHYLNPPIEDDIPF